MGEFQVVKRRHMASIRSIEKDGVEHLLGDFRDFRWSDSLRAFMPDITDFSLSWAMLAHGEVLKAHTHPIQSMMVIYAGSGEVFGDLCRPLNEGDVLVVPPGCSHGFIGGPEGLFAVTVQLGQGFYTNRDEKPRIAFVELEPSLKLLVEYNDKRLRRFAERPIFRLLEDGTLSNPRVRDVFLQHTTTWLEGMDTAIRSQRLTTRNRRYLIDEGEGWLSLGTRTSGSCDTVLETTASWFDYHMFVLDDPEKAAIVHLVVENARDLYCERVARRLDPDLVQRRGRSESGGDPPTARAVKVLRRESTRTYERLQRVVAEAWNMVEVMTERIEVLTRSS